MPDQTPSGCGPFTITTTPPSLNPAEPAQLQAGDFDYSIDDGGFGGLVQSMLGNNGDSSDGFDDALIAVFTDTSAMQSDIAGLDGLLDPAVASADELANSELGDAFAAAGEAQDALAAGAGAIGGVPATPPAPTAPAPPSGGGGGGGGTPQPQPQPPPGSGDCPSELADVDFEFTSQDSAPQTQSVLFAPCSQQTVSVSVSILEGLGTWIVNNRDDFASADKPTYIDVTVAPNGTTSGFCEVLIDTAGAEQKRYSFKAQFTVPE